MTTRTRLSLVLELGALLLCLWMLATRGHAEERASVAVLQNRADAIDRHLESTDKSVNALQERINQLSNDLSEKTGEERAAWAGLSLICGLGVVIQIRTRKGSNG